MAAGREAVMIGRPARESAWRRLWHREAVQGYVWIAPAVGYIGLLVAYPFVMSLFLSVSDATVGKSTWRWVGLRNYARLMDDPIFWQTVRNTFIFTFGSEAIKLVLGLGMAFALNQRFRGKRLAQGLLLIPFVIPIALTALAWRWMFDSLYSVVNWMLMHAGLTSYPWQWLGEPELAMWSVIIVNVWRGMPFSAVVLMAGLTAVPLELIEAAKLDGAGPFRRFHYVIVPIIRPVLIVGLLYSIVLSITDFSTVFLMTSGGPYNSTQVFGTYAYLTGINGGDLGGGAAITLFVFPLLAVTVIALLTFLRRD